MFQPVESRACDAPKEGSDEGKILIIKVKLMEMAMIRKHCNENY